MSKNLGGREEYEKIPKKKLFILAGFAYSSLQKNIFFCKTDLDTKLFRQVCEINEEI